ncbi:Obp4 [Eciton burchellii]|nr:Obp4 [Eciton burchellii]
MNRFVFFLALAAAINADINYVAETFETDVPTIQACLDEAKLTIEELTEGYKKWKDVKDENDIDKEALAKHKSFLACMLEKKELMKDSKLVLDKIWEEIQNDKDLSKIPSKEVLTECVNSLNENVEMTREDRALGVTVCISLDKEDER